MQIPLASLTATATDPDGDAITLAGINLTTTNGITLTTNSTFITYSNNANVADRFTFTIAAPACWARRLRSAAIL